MIEDPNKRSKGSPPNEDPDLPGDDEEFPPMSEHWSLCPQCLSPVPGHTNELCYECYAPSQRNPRPL